MVLEGCDLISTAIREGVLAGAYSEIARMDPGCRAGFTRLADKHSALARLALGEMARRGFGEPSAAVCGIGQGFPSASITQNEERNRRRRAAPKFEIGADPLSGLRGPLRSPSTDRQTRVPGAA